MIPTAAMRAREQSPQTWRARLNPFRWWPSHSDRRWLLLWLLAPLILMLVSVGLALAVTVRVPTVGTLYSDIAAMGVMYVILGAVMAPPYAITVGWWVWRTRQRDHDEEWLLRQLWRIPLVAALFSWFPGLLMTSAAPMVRLQMFVTMAIPAAVTLCVWAGLVHLCFFLRRKLDEALASRNKPR
jgi:polyferredoxin